MKKQPAIYLVRHGETALNNENQSVDRIRGWKDIPLNEEGIKDGEKAAEKLKDVKIDYIYSSDLSRAKDTADLINVNHHVPIISMTELRPWNLGDYQGKVTSDVIDDINKLIVDENKPAPGGESFNEFRTRYLKVLQTLINRALQYNEEIVVTTHLRNLKLCEGWIKNHFAKDYTVDCDAVINDNHKPGAIMQIDMNKYKKSLI